MIDLSLLMLILVFILPIVVMIVNLVSKDINGKHLTLFGIVLVMAGLIGLGVAGEVHIETRLTFLAEPITFSITHSAILLYLAVLLVLGSLLLWEDKTEKAMMTSYQWSLLHLSLSFGFVSFISGQFMIRYIALDIVGLLAALAVLSTFKAKTALGDFIIIFQILRLADLSLLAAILLTNHITGTLDITQMIMSATTMSPNARMWVFLGFLLALVIKLAIWPFSLWLERARQSAPRITFWISGLLMPALGFYLLYRVTPIINSAVIFQNITLYTALFLALLTLLLTSLQEIKFDRFVHMGSMMGCFLVAAVAFGGGQYLLVYMIGLILHRWLMLLDEQSVSPYLTTLTILFPAILNVAFLVINLDVFPIVFSMGWVGLTLLDLFWDIVLGRKPVLLKALKKIGADIELRSENKEGLLVKLSGLINRTLESGFVTDGIVHLSDSLGRVADWVYENVEMGLEKLWTGIGRKILMISEGTLQRIEVEGSKKTDSLVNNALDSLSAYEQRFKRKPLRWDLAWIPFLLVVILVMLFVL